VIWWALTRKWPHDLNDRLTSGYPARPTDPSKPATIEFGLPRNRGRCLTRARTFRATRRGAARRADPGTRASSSTPTPTAVSRYGTLLFSTQEVWDGLEVEVEGKRTIVCNGLIRDWASWTRENGHAAAWMSAVLTHLAPAGESLAAGPLMRLSINDARDIPSIQTRYSPSVPILHASSGVRRATGLAYMLLWSWIEHLNAAQLLGERPTNQVVVLFDEIESHLHPRWQRSILRSVLDVAGIMHPGAEIQLVAATHSPLIMAAAEPVFNAETDAWFDLDLDTATGKVVLEKRGFVRRGDVSAWLRSDAFGLKEARSLEAEQAIDAAERLLGQRREQDSVSAAEVDAVDRRLRATLSDVDRFWVRWSAAFPEREGDA
jgi:hypothetical protein